MSHRGIDVLTLVAMLLWSLFWLAFFSGGVRAVYRYEASYLPGYELSDGFTITATR